MSKQIFVKSIKISDSLIKKMFDEAQKYLENIGFSKTQILSVTDQNITFRSFAFTSGKENILVEYRKDMFEDILRLSFAPMEIQFVYDILLMRFRQIASDEQEGIYISNI
jgi:hypothetical protein